MLQPHLFGTKIVLGSFDFSVFQKEQGPATLNSFNISQIPISIEFFSRWFVDNVLNQKSTRKSYPILNFIRSLSNSLISHSLLEACVNRDVEQRLIFQTGQFSSYSQGGKDVLGELTKNTVGAGVVDTDKHRPPPPTAGETKKNKKKDSEYALPMDGDDTGDTKIENFFQLRF